MGTATGIISKAPRAVTAATTVSGNEQVIVDATTAAVTVTGPAPGTARRWGVKKSDASVNAVAISYTNAAGNPATVNLTVVDDGKTFEPLGSGYVAVGADRSRTVDDGRYEGLGFSAASKQFVYTTGITNALDQTTIYGYGHSYMAGGGTTGNYPYFTRFGARIRALATNLRAVSGTTLGQQLAAAIGTGAGAWVPGTRGLVLLDGVLNSVINVTAANDNQEKATFAQTLRTFLRLLRSAAWVPETDASVVLAGTWSTVTLAAMNGGSIVKTTTAGDTATITVSNQSEITVMLLGFTAATAGASYTITVNGTQVATGTTAAQVSPNITATFCDIGIRLAGLPTNATIVITKTGADSRELYFDGYLTKAAVTPAIILFKDPDLSATGMANSAAQANRTVANLRSFNAVLDTVAAETEFADGSIVVADPMALPWDFTTMIGTDNVHPNYLGHGLITDAALIAAQKLGYARGAFPV